MLRRTITCYPHTGGKGLSVIIAGATGNTGSELVTRLVSHKSVTRIVALTRNDISVDRWKHHFPNLRTTDALKYLSIVAVDWDRIYQDALGIPASVLCSRPSLVESRDEEMREISLLSRKQRREEEAAAAAAAAASSQGSHSHHRRDGEEHAGEYLYPEDTFSSLSHDGSHNVSATGVGTRSRRDRVTSAERRRNSSGSGNGDNSPHVRGRRDVSAREAFRKVRRRLRVTDEAYFGAEESQHRKKSADGIGGGGNGSTGNSMNAANGFAPSPLVTDTRRLISPEHLITLHERNAIQTICQDPYYRSVFGGHTIAINCLGSHRVLMGRKVTTVDLDFSLAFAKLVRLFNCVKITDAFLQDVTVAGTEDSLRSYGTRRSLVTENTVEWHEIRAACFGRMVNIGFNGAAASAAAATPLSSSAKGGDKACNTSTNTADDEENGFHRYDAPSSSDLTAAEAATAVAAKTAAKEAAAAAARQRKRSYEARKADEAQLRLWDQAIEKAMRGRQHTSHTLQHYVQISASGASEFSPLAYFRVHGICDNRVLALYDYDPSTLDERNTKESVTSVMARPASWVKPAPLVGGDNVLAPTLNHRADVTIFRPSLLRRRNATMLEKFLSYMTAPLDVSAFADVIVDDVMAKQRQIEEGLAAMALLQQRLNEKYKYKLYVTREDGVVFQQETPTWDELKFGAASNANDTNTTNPQEYYAAGYSTMRSKCDWETGPIVEEVVLGEKGSKAKSKTTKGSSSSSNATSGGSSSSSSSSITTTTTTTVAPTVSRAKLIEQVAREKADIKARLGVSQADIEASAAGEGDGSLVVGGVATPGHVGGIGAIKSPVPTCLICDIRDKVGSVPGAAIVTHGDIKRRHAQLAGITDEEEEARLASRQRKMLANGQVGTAISGMRAAAAAKYGKGGNKDGAAVGGSTPREPLQEQFCHQS